MGEEEAEEEDMVEEVEEDMGNDAQIKFCFTLINA